MSLLTDRMADMKPDEFEEEPSRLAEVKEATEKAFAKNLFGYDAWSELHLEQISITLAIIADALTERR